MRRSDSKRILHAIVAALGFCSLAASAQANELCTGYDPLTSSWGMIVIADAQTEAYCPIGSAVLSHRMLFGSVDMPFAANCCPLPAGSMLDRHRFAIKQCPEGHVVTGARMLPRPDEEPQLELRCTAIDREQFELGPPATIMNFEPVEEFLTYFRRWIRGEKSWHTTRSNLPPRIRYGMGRLTRTTWSRATCIGYPWGSVMTGSGTRGCKDFVFRPLESKVPRVEVPCWYIDDIYSPSARCVP